MKIPKENIHLLPKLIVSFRNPFRLKFAHESGGLFNPIRTHPILTLWAGLVLASLVAGTLTRGPQSVWPFMIMFIALGWAAVFAMGIWAGLGR